MFTERELAERGISQEKRHQWLDHKDDLANLQLLQGLPNQEKSDQEFEAWVRDEHPTPQDLEHYRKNHLIPDVDLSFENYPVFLQAREEMIKKRLREILTVKETLMERK